MVMHNPPHSGGIVKRHCLEPLGLSVTDAARHLGVSRQSLSELVNDRAGISVDMMIRLSKAFGSSPETQLGLQMAYDLWHARHRIDDIKVERIKAARARPIPLSPTSTGCEMQTRPGSTTILHGYPKISGKGKRTQTGSMPAIRRAQWSPIPGQRQVKLHRKSPKKS